jgi:hypothetical protein
MTYTAPLFYTIHSNGKDTRDEVCTIYLNYKYQCNYLLVKRNYAYLPRHKNVEAKASLFFLIKGIVMFYEWVFYYFLISLVYLIRLWK